MPDVIRVDPRPAVVNTDDGRWQVAGARCRACRHAVAYRWPRCPVCGGTLAEVLFSSLGTVWSSTVVRIPVPGRMPPYALAYVDLDDGPRVLAHIDGGTDSPVPVGSRVELAAPSDNGDLRVETLR
jgi:hypothetical protein